MKSRFTIALAAAFTAVSARPVAADTIGAMAWDTSQAISGIAVVIVLLYARRRKRPVV